jgi:hypothetical protein
VEDRVEREEIDGGIRDRSLGNGHCSVAVFITKNHIKVLFYFPSGNRCEIPWLA